VVVCVVLVVGGESVEELVVEDDVVDNDVGATG